MEQRIHYLLESIAASSIQEEEWNELLEAIRNDHSGEIIAALDQYQNSQQFRAEFIPDSPEWQAVLMNALDADRTFARPSPTGKLSKIPILRLAAVAAVILATLLTVLYVFMLRNETPSITASRQMDISPGKQGAVLTLADGSELVLDSAKNGIIAKQKGSEILLSDGEMTYHPQETSDKSIEYNTMTTPKGRQFQFTLPDGTKVWLNAASSLRYPTQFTDKKRVVEITGEAFFEVTPNIRQPFIVNAAKYGSIEVLGTSFNVNAYPNEHYISTTLLSGMVKVENTSSDLPVTMNKEMILKPGQQARIIPGDKVRNGAPNAISIDLNPNTDKITAWKKGVFNFDGSSVVEVMREVERWYDIEVVYEGSPPAITFYGKMGKDLSLKDLLEILEKSKVKFELEGRILKVKQ